MSLPHPPEPGNDESARDDYFENGTVDLSLAAFHLRSVIAMLESGPDEDQSRLVGSLYDPERLRSAVATLEVISDLFADMEGVDLTRIDEKLRERGVLSRASLEFSVLFDSIEVSLREHQSASESENREQAPMSSSENPYDAFNAINDARSEAREHTDTLVAEIRREAREDRREILGAISEVAKTSNDNRTELAEVRTSIDMLKWFVAAGIAIAGLVVAIIQLALG